MTTQLPPEQERFARILHPYMLQRHLRAVREGTRFVHYTNADAAMSILRSKEVWMRKSSCMNDYLEVQYGLNRLYKAYRQTEVGEKFKSALNQIFDGITTDIEKLFDSWTPHFQTNTYFTCVSEHKGAEDTFGRLSMWRAYGETTGVGLVVNNSAFVTAADGLKAYTSPVAYLNDQDFENEFGKIADNIAAEADFLRAHSREEITARVFNMLRFAALCTKHPGFAEEMEWRIVYCPTLEVSPYLTKEIHVIKNVPQPIYKIPLKDIPEVGFRGEMSALINRIIIGPTQYPLALAEAFVQLLGEVGLSDAENKVFVSDIPIRR